MKSHVIIIRKIHTEVYHVTGCDLKMNAESILGIVFTLRDREARGVINAEDTATLRKYEQMVSKVGRGTNVEERSTVEVEA